MMVQASSLSEVCLKNTQKTKLKIFFNGMADLKAFILLKKLGNTIQEALDFASLRMMLVQNKH